MCRSLILGFLAYLTAICAYRSLDHQHTQPFSIDSRFLSAKISANRLTDYHRWPIFLTGSNCPRASTVQKNRDRASRKVKIALTESTMTHVEWLLQAMCPQNWLRWTAHFREISERHAGVRWESWSNAITTDRTFSWMTISERVLSLSHRTSKKIKRQGWESLRLGNAVSHISFKKNSSIIRWMGNTSFIVHGNELRMIYESIGRVCLPVLLSVRRRIVCMNILFCG